MRKNQVIKVTVAIFSLLLLIISFSQLDLLVLASNNIKTSLLLDRTSIYFNHLQYCFQDTGGHLNSTVVYPLVFCLNHPAFSVLFFGFAMLLIINLDRRKKQKVALVRSELMCYNMVPGFDGDAASQGGAEGILDGNESKDADIIPTEKPDQENDVAKSTPAAVEGNDGSKPILKPSLASRIVKNREYHPAFICACKLVWDPNKLNLDFYEEHAVTVEPIRTDLLILKDPNTEITDQIGSFFRTYNFIQFKSEDDKLEPDDLLKEINYAISFKLLYADVRFEDCSLTIFCPPDVINVLSFLEQYGYPVRYGNNPNIMYVDLCFNLKMQIVVLGDLAGENYEYAPFNMFTKKLDEKRTLDFTKFNESYIQPGDEDRLKQYETILNLMLDKKPEIMRKIFTHLLEEGNMSKEQLCRELFPEVLAAQEERTLKLILGNIQKAAKKHSTTYEDEIEDWDLPDGCSREEALRRLHAM